MEEVRMHLAYRWFTRLGFEALGTNRRKLPQKIQL